MLKKLGIAAVAALVIGAGTAQAAPITVSGAGQTFSVNFNGFNDILGTIAGLTASAAFSVSSFSASTVVLAVTLTNTSTAPIDASRVSALGFNTTPNVFGGSVTGIFNTVTINGSMPNGIGAVETCASNQNCAGGASGGPTIGTSGAFTLTLNFNPALTGDPPSFTFDQFYVRYQSIDSATLGITGGSASGSSNGDNQTLPEPMSLLLLGAGLVLSAARLRRQ